MHPICWQFGSRPIYWFGVLMALAFLAVISHWNRLALRTGRPSGFGSELGFWTILAGILGARLAYVLANASEFISHPLEILRMDHGGLVYYGGFIGGGLAVLLFARARREPLWALADFAITGIPLGHAFGRIGCLLNGCCFGAPTGLPWGVCFPGTHDSHGLPVHPTQIYESVFNLALYGVLLLFYLRGRRAGAPTGRVLALYLLLYPPFRFLVEFLRGDERLQALGLNVAQEVSLALFAAGVALWFLRARQRRPTEVSSQ
ncbi:MAG: prolipoprotein diacylglyceryl transferase [Kiritimatiellaeota bacterium]|nr:prolipoprotein diacylglyceryl transferase [Kiritimatiellota bacterium]